MTIDATTRQSIRQAAADHHATATEIARLVGVTVPTVIKYAGRPFPRSGLSSARALTKTERNAAVVERYRSTSLSFTQVGTEFGITYERVRQIVARHEECTGELLPRKHEGERAPRVEVRCLNCGATRRYLACVKKLPRRCARCDAMAKAHAMEKPERTRQVIDARRRLGTWTRALDEILGKRGDRSLEGQAYRYLASRKRWPEVAELWPRGVAPWILALYTLHPVQSPAFAKPKGTR